MASSSSDASSVSGANISLGKYGTFTGVFMPTFIILAVFLYLRLGWAVGNAGLVGGLVVILMCFGITGATALSMSSITTNIRIGAGGPYSIISQSLGLEVGGSVGIPLYLAQALIIALYIFGFREGWQMLFPEHPALAIDLLTFGALCLVTYLSTALAFRLQYVVLAIIAASIVAMIVGAATGPIAEEGLHNVELFAGGEDVSFWTVFAVFFPAATGVTAGALMSGELRNPRRSIPLGTMAAIATALSLYVLGALWLAGSVSFTRLRDDLMVIVDTAAFGPVVSAALLAATFSSALASMVGAPRILQALGEHRVIPGGKWVSRRADDGEPRNALMITALIVGVTLVARDLNAIAPLITMFFLITYLMINLVVFYEQTLDLTSFRPLLKIPRLVPGLGFIGCLFAMFIISPVFGLVALIGVGAVYLFLARRRLNAPFGDLRSGLFVTLAEWAARQVWDLPEDQQRAWKPNLLVAVKDPRELRGAFLFIQDLISPRGSVKLIGLHPEGESNDLARHLQGLAADFRSRQLFATWLVAEAPDFATGITASVQHAQGSFPRPNILFLQMPDQLEESLDYPLVVDRAEQRNIGSLLYAPHPKAGLGKRQTVNVWIRDRSPDWSISMDIGNLDLSLLIGHKLQKNWNAHLRVVTVVEDDDQHTQARRFLKQLLDVARLPDIEIVVAGGTFRQFVTDTPQADLHIFGMLSDPDLDFARQMVDETDASCIFVRDSGTENALA